MTLTSEASLQPIDEEVVWQAFETHPPHFLQNTWVFGPIIWLLAMVLHIWLVPTLGLHPPHWLSYTVVMLYLGANILDIFTTHRCMCLHQAFVDKGYETPFFETNLMMPDYISLRQNIFSLPTLFSMMGTIYVYFLPIMGVGMALFHLFASWSNVGVYKRAQYQLHWLEKVKV